MGSSDKDIEIKDENYSVFSSVCFMFDGVIYWLCSG